MHEQRNWLSGEHRKLWLALGGWTAYERWAEDDTEDDWDEEITMQADGKYL